MRRGFVPALAALVLTPAGATAQENPPVAVPCGEGECELSPERNRQLQAKADSLRATREPPPAAGGAYERFFDLLGTERPRPAGRFPDSSPSPQIPDVAPEVTHVVTGGYVLASIPVTELDAPFWTRPTFESRGGAPVFILEQMPAEDPDRERVVEIHPGVPGEYRLDVVSETRDL